MKQQHAVWRRIAGIVGLFALAVVRAPPVRAQTPTEQIAECMEEAWEANKACIDDLPWWAEILCAVRFEADVILCAPQFVYRSLK
jgi:hypothetical protein